MRQLRDPVERARACAPWFALIGLLFALPTARAAEDPHLDDPQVQYAIGIAHITGRGASKDPTEAVGWLRKAALLGHADAQVQLGICYQQGLGIDIDLVQALEWFRKAAAQGNTRGELQVGLAYWRGRGVPQNLGLGLEHIRKAGEAGHAKAQVELGNAYRKGLGVEPDPMQAAFWFGLANAQGSPVARVALPSLRHQLSEAQRAQVDERIANWQRDHAPAPEALPGP
jgi:TPR repeat protein